MNPTGRGRSIRDAERASAQQVLSREIAAEQRHVDRVYEALQEATRRADLVQADGMARGRTDRTGDIRDEELTGLFERDALVYRAARRRAALEREHEGLVFGRLDLDADSGEGPREVRYIGRLGVRDEDYDPLVIDWRAPAASPFYRATPLSPHGVVRRRVLRCQGSRVVGAEDDLMSPTPPDDMVVLGEGALLAALGRSRSGRMRDIVATIQAHQDEAIRADARGVVEITGGPGTGKTVVALHRAAYLLYSDRRRFEGGGVLVVGPSAAYTAYIERVLPSLGEDAVTLRSLGDVVDAVTATHVDPPSVAAVKGSLRIRRVLSRVARDTIPGAPDALRIMVGGQPVHLDRRTLDRCRGRVLRGHRRNAAGSAMRAELTAAAWSQVHSQGPRGTEDEEREEFAQVFAEHLDVERFMEQWWRPVDPREVLLWLADRERVGRHGAGVLTSDEAAGLADSYRRALTEGTWSVADVALIDDLSSRLGVVPEVRQERGFYEVELLDDAESEAVADGMLRGLSRAGGTTTWGGSSSVGAFEEARGGTPLPGEVWAGGEVARELLLSGRLERPSEYAHILVDEAQDVSPMHWRMLSRRGRRASWTIVGDAAQASWPDAPEAAAARDDAFGTKARQSFHLTTNYRNAREIFDYAAAVISAHLPDADLPDAVRETGVVPLIRTVPPEAHSVADAVRDSLRTLSGEVDGTIGVITPARWSDALTCLGDGGDERIVVVDPLSAKGLEYDACVVVDPDEITSESPGGIRVLYVALTRAAHRMHVLGVAPLP
ncbi:MAG: AAA family ATPase [Dermatophilaceae bacterium]